jgi:histidine phosphotransferase ChpT
MNAEFPIDEVDLCALVGSRLCHDLVSPVGAIGNGVELLAMAPAGAGEAGPPAELDLVRESVENAQARLRFFRIAFGQSGGEQEVGRAEVLGILTELYKSGRLKVHWAVEENRPRAEVKLAFLLLQCLESAMPYGGQVHIGHTKGAWRVQGEAEKLRLEPMLWESLASLTVPAALRPSQVHFALVPKALRALQMDLSVTTADTRVQFAVR